MKVLMMIVSLIMSVCFGNGDGISFPGFDGIFNRKEIVEIQRITPMPKPTNAKSDKSTESNGNAETYGDSEDKYGGKRNEYFLL